MNSVLKRSAAIHERRHGSSKSWHATPVQRPDLQDLVHLQHRAGGVHLELLHLQADSSTAQPSKPLNINMESSGA